MFHSCSTEKTAPKSSKYSRNETILKIGHHAKAIAHAKSSFGLKIKIQKNMPKSILQINYRRSWESTAPKNS